MTAIKICGLTRPEDVEMACRLGARYVGFNFAAVSRRRVDLPAARELAAAAAPGVTRVGVFVEETPSEIAAAAEAARLDLAQIHRPLSPEDLDAVPLRIIAVAAVSGGTARVPPPELLARCESLLFDTAMDGVAGGTGARFDWTMLEGRRFPVALFLGGGLMPENVGEAIARVKPAAVDVASGVERAPGVKDADRMRRFFEAVEEADARTG